VIDTPRVLLEDDFRAMPTKSDRALLQAYHSSPMKTKDAVKELLLGSATKSKGSVPK
jgi:hypothetical protein